MHDSNTNQLKRSLSLPLVTFYGIGTILGAGIYVLVGKVAGYAGMLAPLAFLVASVVAAFSALSYAELSSRFPKSAGEAVYIREGLGSTRLAVIVGLMIVLMTSVSSATLLHGFVGYLQVFWDVNKVLVIICMVILFTAIVIWGIEQSVWLAAAMTVVELFGLLLILWVARGQFVYLPERFDEMLLPGLDVTVWTGAMLGAFVAFYAFIGFEDIVNVAEEVKDPSRNLPRAIIWALVVTTVLYLLVSIASVLSIAPQQLAETDAPLAMLYEETTSRSPVIITVISLISITNGMLIQMIMASRILYGLSRQGWLHSWFGRVNAWTHTPWQATGTVGAMIMTAALILPLLSLARLTSFIVLTVFVLVNLSLIWVKRRQPVHSGTTIPVWVPVCGVISCIALLASQFLILI